MKTVRNSIILGMTVLALGATTLGAQAQQPLPAEQAQAVQPAPGARHAHMKARWAERAAKRNAALHDTLKLSGAQEAAWASYTAALKRPERPVRTASERAAWKAMPAPERMARHLDMGKQRLARMETRLAATTAFYATLSDEQKKLFDQHSMQRGGHHHMKRGMAS